MYVKLFPDSNILIAFINAFEQVRKHVKSTMNIEELEWYSKEDFDYKTWEELKENHKNLINKDIISAGDLELIKKFTNPENEKIIILPEVYAEVFTQYSSKATKPWNYGREKFTTCQDRIDIFNNNPYIEHNFYENIETDIKFLGSANLDPDSAPNKYDRLDTEVNDLNTKNTPEVSVDAIYEWLDNTKNEVIKDIIDESVSCYRVPDCIKSHKEHLEGMKKYAQKMKNKRDNLDKLLGYKSEITTFIADLETKILSSMHNINTSDPELEEKVKRKFAERLARNGEELDVYDIIQIQKIQNLEAKYKNTKVTFWTRNKEFIKEALDQIIFPYSSSLSIKIDSFDRDFTLSEKGFLELFEHELSKSIEKLDAPFSTIINNENVQNYIENLEKEIESYYKEGTLRKDPAFVDKIKILKTLENIDNSLKINIDKLFNTYGNSKDTQKALESLKDIFFQRQNLELKNFNYNQKLEPHLEKLLGSLKISIDRNDKELIIKNQKKLETEIDHLRQQHLVNKHKFLVLNDKKKASVNIDYLQQNIESPNFIEDFKLTIEETFGKKFSTFNFHTQAKTFSSPNFKKSIQNIIGEFQTDKLNIDTFEKLFQDYSALDQAPTCSSAGARSKRSISKKNCLDFSDIESYKELNNIDNSALKTTWAKSFVKRLDRVETVLSLELILKALSTGSSEDTWFLTKTLGGVVLVQYTAQKIQNIYYNDFSNSNINSKFNIKFFKNPEEFTKAVFKKLPNNIMKSLPKMTGHGMNVAFSGFSLYNSIKELDTKEGQDNQELIIFSMTLDGGAIALSGIKFGAYAAGYSIPGVNFALIGLSIAQFITEKTKEAKTVIDKLEEKFKITDREKAGIAFHVLIPGINHTPKKLELNSDAHDLYASLITNAINNAKNLGYDGVIISLNDLQINTRTEHSGKRDGLTEIIDLLFGCDRKENVYKKILNEYSNSQVNVISLNDAETYSEVSRIISSKSLKLGDKEVIFCAPSKDNMHVKDHNFKLNEIRAKTCINGTSVKEESYTLTLQTAQNADKEKNNCNAAIGILFDKDNDRPKLLYNLKGYISVAKQGSANQTSTFIVSSKTNITSSPVGENVFILTDNELEHNKIDLSPEATYNLVSFPDGDTAHVFSESDKVDEVAVGGGSIHVVNAMKITSRGNSTIVIGNNDLRVTDQFIKVGENDIYYINKYAPSSIYFQINYNTDDIQDQTVLDVIEDDVIKQNIFININGNFTNFNSIDYQDESLILTLLNKQTIVIKNIKHFENLNFIFRDGALINLDEILLLNADQVNFSQILEEYKDVLNEEESSNNGQSASSDQLRENFKKYIVPKLWENFSIKKLTVHLYPSKDLSNLDLKSYLQNQIEKSAFWENYKITIETIADKFYSVINNNEELGAVYTRGFNLTKDTYNYFSVNKNTKIIVKGITNLFINNHENTVFLDANNHLENTYTIRTKDNADYIEGLHTNKTNIGYLHISGNLTNLRLHSNNLGNSYIYNNQSKTIENDYGILLLPGAVSELDYENLEKLNNTINLPETTKDNVKLFTTGGRQILYNLQDKSALVLPIDAEEIKFLFNDLSIGSSVARISLSDLKKSLEPVTVDVYIQELETLILYEGDNLIKLKFFDLTIEEIEVSSDYPDTINIYGENNTLTIYGWDSSIRPLLELRGGEIIDLTKYSSTDFKGISSYVMFHKIKKISTDSVIHSEFSHVIKSLEQQISKELPQDMDYCTKVMPPEAAKNVDYEEISRLFENDQNSPEIKQLIQATMYWGLALYANLKILSLENPFGTHIQHKIAKCTKNIVSFKAIKPVIDKLLPINSQVFENLNLTIPALVQHFHLNDTVTREIKHNYILENLSFLKSLENASVDVPRENASVDVPRENASVNSLEELLRKLFLDVFKNNGQPKNKTDTNDGADSSVPQPVHSLLESPEPEPIPSMFAYNHHFAEAEYYTSAGVGSKPYSFINSFFNSIPFLKGKANDNKHARQDSENENYGSYTSGKDLSKLEQDIHMIWNFVDSSLILAEFFFKVLNASKGKSVKSSKKTPTEKNPIEILPVQIDILLQKTQQFKKLLESKKNKIKLLNNNSYDIIRYELEDLEENLNNINEKNKSHEKIIIEQIYWEDIHNTIVYCYDKFSELDISTSDNNNSDENPEPEASFFNISYDSFKSYFGNFVEYFHTLIGDA